MALASKAGRWASIALAAAACGVASCARTRVGGWVAGQNAGVTSAITLKADTVVNSLTFSGTSSVGSGLGSSFGAFGPGGRILNLQLQGATSFLVKDGTTTYTAGALTSGNGTTMFGHVLFGATLNFNAGSAFGLGASGGFVKGGDGLLNLNAPTYFGATASFAVNQGRVNLNSGAANTLAAQACMNECRRPSPSLRTPPAAKGRTCVSRDLTPSST